MILQQIFFVFLSGIFLSVLFAFFAGSVKLEKYDAVKPLLMVNLLGFLGCLATTCFSSPFFYITLIFSGFFLYRNKITIKASWSEFYLVPLFILFFLVKFLPLFNFETGVLFCSHSDDYCYIQQTTMLMDKKVELPYYNIVNQYFGSESKFGFYHYFEFYVLSFLKLITGFSLYHLYHFVLWPFLQICGFYAVMRFFSNCYRQATRIDYFFMLTIFSTLRFTVADEIINSALDSAFLKVSFFQNYSFSQPLSFWGGMKNVLTFIFIFPLLELVWERKWTGSLVLFLLNISVSIVHGPICALIIFTFRFIDIIGKKAAAILSVLIFLASQVFIHYQFDYPASLLLLSNFNGLFENYYGLLFAALVFFLCNRGIIRKHSLLAGLLLYPLIYLRHGWFFKLFLVYLGYFLFAYRKTIASLKAYPFLPIFLIISAFASIAGMYITDAGQFRQNFNYIFALVLFCEVLGRFRTTSKSNYLQISAVAVLLPLCYVSLYVDHQRPLHQESPSQLQLPKKEILKAFCLPVYQNIPFHYQNLLGNTLMNEQDNIVVLPGGFDKLQPDKLLTLEKSGRIDENVYFKFWKSGQYGQEGVAAAFARKYDVDLVMIDSQAVYQSEIHYFKRISKSTFREKNKNYFIFRLK